MIELKSIPKNDSDLIWILWLYLGTQIVKLSTKEITLSGNTYCFESIGFNSISSVQSQITIDENHIGSLAQLSFNICKYNDLPEPYASLEFQNYFAPYTTINLLSSYIDFGFCTKDSTNENQINWLNRFSVESYEYADNGINIVANEFIEFEQITLPNDITQNADANNIATYVEFKESAGFPIPITYGRFLPISSEPGLTVNRLQNKYDLAPILLRKPSELQFIVGNYKVKTIDKIYCLDSSGYYLHIYNKDSNNANILYNSISITSINPAFAGNIVFDFYAPLVYDASDKISEPVTLKNSIANLGNSDLDDYIELDPSGSVDYIFLTTQGILSQDITKQGYRYGVGSSMIVGYETLEDNASVTIYNEDYDLELGQLHFTIANAGKNSFFFPLRDFNDDNPLPFYRVPQDTASNYYIGNKITTPQQTQKFRLRYAMLYFYQLNFLGSAPKVVLRKNQNTVLSLMARTTNGKNMVIQEYRI